MPFSVASPYEEDDHASSHDEKDDGREAASQHDSSVGEHRLLQHTVK